MLFDGPWTAPSTLEVEREQSPFRRPRASDGQLVLPLGMAGILDRRREVLLGVVPCFRIYHGLVGLHGCDQRRAITYIHTLFRLCAQGERPTIKTLSWTLRECCLANKRAPEKPHHSYPCKRRAPEL